MAATEHTVGWLVGHVSARGWHRAGTHTCPLLQGAGSQGKLHPQDHKDPDFKDSKKFTLFAHSLSPSPAREASPKTSTKESEPKDRPEDTGRRFPWQPSFVSFSALVWKAKNPTWRSIGWELTSPHSGRLFLRRSLISDGSYILAEINGAKNNPCGPLGVSDPDKGQQMAFHSPLQTLSVQSTISLIRVAYHDYYSCL